MSQTYNSDVIQFTYHASKFRSLLGLHEFNYTFHDILKLDKPLSTPVSLSGILYAYLVPLPFIENYISLGFFNWFIYIFFISFLILKKKIDGFLLFFLLFYPSIVLYCSLALRDTIILILTLLTFLFLIEKKYILSLLFLFLVFAFRPQNAYLLLPLILFYSLWFNNIIGSSNLLKILLTLVSSFIILINYNAELIQIVNDYRIARAREDLFLVEDVPLANDLQSFFIMVVSSIPRFFIEPTIFNASNLFQFVQASENIATIFLIIYVYNNSRKLGFGKSMFWILSLFFIAGIYGYTQSNIGALTRYKYVFIVLYIFAVNYDVKLNFKKITN
tara:strand:+ start:19226 stop:20221 length:996 start_codon:yes stop_codon:yes gene_type:complete